MGHLKLVEGLWSTPIDLGKPALRMAAVNTENVGQGLACKSRLDSIKVFTKIWKGMRQEAWRRVTGTGKVRVVVS